MFKRDDPTLQEGAFIRLARQPSCSLYDAGVVAASLKGLQGWIAESVVRTDSIKVKWGVELMNGKNLCVCRSFPTLIPVFHLNLRKYIAPRGLCRDCTFLWAPDVHSFVHPPNLRRPAEAALRKDPDNLKALQRQGRVLLAMDDLEAAKARMHGVHACAGGFGCPAGGCFRCPAGAQGLKDASLSSSVADGLPFEHDRVTLLEQDVQPLEVHVQGGHSSLQA